MASLTLSQRIALAKANRYPGTTSKRVWGLQKGDDIAVCLDLSKENKNQVKSQHVPSTS